MQKIMKHIVSGIAISGLLMNVACTGQLEDDLDTEFGAFSAANSLVDETLKGQVESRNQHGYYLSTKLWTSNSISVCWQTSGYSEEKGDVQAVIENQWEKQSDIDFTGWGSCQSGTDYNIKIRIVDDSGGSYVEALGNGLDNMAAGMRLNFTFQNWNQGCQFDVFDCLVGDALHEFGHALAIAHEHNRPNTPCSANPQGTDGDTEVGIHDNYSIMNYCYDSEELSPGDIRTIQQMYGKTIQTGTVGLISANDNYMVQLDAALTSDPYLKPNFLWRKYVSTGQQPQDYLTRFTMSRNSNGTYSFKGANNKYVRVNNSNYLRATDNSIGNKARFSIIQNSDGTISLKSSRNNKYVRVFGNNNKKLEATSSSIGTNEKFSLKYY